MTNLPPHKVKVDLPPKKTDNQDPQNDPNQGINPQGPALRKALEILSKSLDAAHDGEPYNLEDLTMACDYLIRLGHMSEKVKRIILNLDQYDEKGGDDGK